MEEDNVETLVEKEAKFGAVGVISEKEPDSCGGGSVSGLVPATVTNDSRRTSNSQSVRSLFDIADSLIDAVSQEAEDSIRSGHHFNPSSQAINGIYLLLSFI